MCWQFRRHVHNDRSAGEADIGHCRCGLQVMAQSLSMSTANTPTSSNIITRSMSMTAAPFPCPLALPKMSSTHFVASALRVVCMSLPTSIARTITCASPGGIQSGPCRSARPWRKSFPPFTVTWFQDKVAKRSSKTHPTFVCSLPASCPAQCGEPLAAK